MKNTIIYEKKIEQKYVCDLLIVGGGPAGVAAAVSAAREGKSVMLLEQYGALGGMGTIGLVPEMMTFDDGRNLLSSGFGKEIKETLFGDEIQMQGYNIRVEELKRLYDRLILESGVKLLFFTKVIDVQKENDRICNAIVSSRSGIYAVKASAFLDCTGDGALSCMAGAKYDFGDEEHITMPATLCSFWSGIDFAKKTKPDGAHVGDAYVNGVLSSLDLLLPGIKETDRKTGVGGGNVGHAFAVNDLDEECLTETMISARKTVAEYENYYRGYVVGAENANLCFTANVLGVRESRRIVCDYTMTVADYLSRAVFDDEIGRYNYPIDIHPKKADEESVKEFDKITSLRYDVGESYGISLKCLIVKGLDNLFVAGKCVGADREMQASMRVMPCCFITGQAAAIAACVCVERGCSSHEVDVKEVQKRLKNIGMYLPNYRS